MAEINEIIGAFFAMDSVISIFKSISSYQSALNVAVASGSNIAPAFTKFIIDYITGLFSPEGLIIGLIVSLMVASKS